jgi:tRNA A37 threonylcarbamoyladenosine dehydratase
MKSMPEPVHDAARKKASIQPCNRSIVVAGVGSIGLGVVDAFAGMHIPSDVHIIDADCFKTASLDTRQFIEPSAIGQDKTLFASRHAARIHPAEDGDDSPQA